ncbi:hotdog fold thioesterase [Salinicola socius]|uniref:Esterase n=1 Tax=Salinicola socius TaxID=404433 RepID=A0A1Q8SNH4_9GAMM|nr:hotdog fold thioesterase [Salinicola socius]OLO02988.1 esterase [Salinicola socius]
MPIWKRESSLEALTAECRNTLVSHVGIEFTELGEDCLRGRMPVDARTHQPYGLLHGGASVVLAETLGSIAANLCLADESKMAVGLDINANHVRAVREGWVEGCARPLHLGATTQLWEIRIEDERGRLVCMSRLTMAVVNRG